MAQLVRQRQDELAVVGELEGPDPPFDRVRPRILPEHRLVVATRLSGSLGERAHVRLLADAERVDPVVQAVGVVLQAVRTLVQLAHGPLEVANVPLELVPAALELTSFGIGQVGGPVGAGHVVVVRADGPVMLGYVPLVLPDRGAQFARGLLDLAPPRFDGQTFGLERPLSFPPLFHAGLTIVEVEVHQRPVATPELEQPRPDGPFPEPPCVTKGLHRLIRGKSEARVQTGERPAHGRDAGHQRSGRK